MESQAKTASEQYEIYQTCSCSTTNMNAWNIYGASFDEAPDDKALILLHI